MFFDRGSFSRLSVAMSFKCNFHWVVKNWKLCIQDTVLNKFYFV
jgi:hypothetical protein